MSVLLSVKNLSLSFDTQRVFSKVNFSVNKGETLVIMGTSGSGKTSLLRSIIGLVSPTKGDILFHGTKITTKNGLSLKRKIGIVFQKPVAFNRSVFDNVAFGLRMRHLNENLIATKVRQTLLLVGISEDLFSKNALHLSGGEIQRIALARSIIVEPELLLLDEPTANLDDENIKKFESLLKKVIKQKGMTTIIATHDKEQAKRLGKVCFLEAGTLKRVDI